MKGARILIVDDDPDIRQAAALALAPHVNGCDEATAPAEAAQMVRESRYDAVLLDMNFLAGARNGEAGLAAIANLRGADPALGVVFLTAYGGVSLAVQAMKQGGDDFLLKPWRNAQLIAAVRDAVARTEARRRPSTLAAVEQSTIAEALQRHEGNISRAAASLGLTRQALYRRLARDG
ncbi:DNA-binding response regulator [uncultured Sphingomonas sp.]|uniref:DNA-binding response regulator n=1 Tax=uncultured Sphingomonas sp. TaxID=158754 RepID=UPI0025D91DFA|nr:DNA-binding response regulator [uncultured Sphingomonas sp.]